MIDYIPIDKEPISIGIPPSNDEVKVKTRAWRKPTNGRVLARQSFIDKIAPIPK